MKKPSPNEFRSIVESGDISLLEKLAVEFPLSTRLALLDYEIRAKEQKPHIIGNPLRVFVSYKWENVQLKRRAQEVAEYLRAKGYSVFLDQDTLSAHETLEEIVQYVSEIANCDQFLVIATPGYIESLSGCGNIGWVYDEYKYAMSLASIGKIEIVGVEVEGLDLFTGAEQRISSAIPESLGDASFVYEQYVDFSVCFPSAKHRIKIPLNGNLSTIDSLFPRQAEKNQNIEQDIIMSAMKQIDTRLAKGQINHALNLIQKHSSLGELPELLYRKMICETQKGNNEIAAELAQRLSTIRFLDFPSLMKVIQVLKDAGRVKYALQLTLAFIRSISLGRRDSEAFSVFNQPDFCTRYYSPNPELVRLGYPEWGHWTVAEILYGCGERRSANNHLKAAHQLMLREEAPDHIKVASLFGFGQLCLNNGHLLSAKRYLLDALAIPGIVKTEYCSLTYNYLLVALWGMGEYEELKFHLTEAMMSFPDEAVFTRINMAVVNGSEALTTHKPIGEETFEESCNVCKSIFESDICSSCGARIDPSHDRCIHCDHTGGFPSGLLAAGISFRCPICLTRVSV